MHTNKRKNKSSTVKTKKLNGTANRLMGTRCNATMLTRLIGTKHGVQLRLMRVLFVWQRNVTHSILLQPRIACCRKLGLLARLATQPSSESTPGWRTISQDIMSSVTATWLQWYCISFHVYDCVVLKSYYIFDQSVNTGNFTWLFKSWPLRRWG